MQTTTTHGQAIVSSGRRRYNELPVAETLDICEIILTLQGESRYAGLPCTLIRLAGCNLDCSWCDTPYAREEGRRMSLKEVLRRVGRLGCRRAEVTGGEPLIQSATPALLRSLCEKGYETLLETNGSKDIAHLDPRVIRVVDFKCPASGQAEANRWANVEHLTPRDEVKFVIADQRDYRFAREAVETHELLSKAPVTFSPVHGVLSPSVLAEWILADSLDVRLGLQLHRIIWPGRDRGC